MMSLVKQHSRQYMPCSINFSITLQTEILSTVISDFLKQMIILKPFSRPIYIKVPLKHQKKQTKFMFAKFQKNIFSGYIILIIQRLEGKHCIAR